jgi:hypothetical protein
VHKHRLTVDMQAGTVRPESLEIVHLAPGEVYQREPTGDLKRMRESYLMASERYVWTALHDDLAEAAAAAAEELRSRARLLSHLAEQCEAIEEGANNG